MFALPFHQPSHSIVFTPPSFVNFDSYSHSTLSDPFLARRQLERQRQLALVEQAHQEELIHRRRRRFLLEEQERDRQAELAYRVALLHRAEREERVRRMMIARKRQAAAEEQRRNEEEEAARRIHLCRQQQAVPSPSSLLDLLFGGLAPEKEEAEPVDASLPRLANFADPPSPTLSASSASTASSFDFVDHLSLSSSSSAADVDSDGDSTSSSSTYSSSVDVSAALSALSDLTSSFDSRRSVFVAPSALSFQPSPSPSSDRPPSPPLAFTSSNAPLFAYEDFLLSLLTKIDAVESAGDGEVRRKRKELVRRVEEELRRIDEIKEREWERQSASSGSSSEEEEGDAELVSSDDDTATQNAKTFRHPIIPFALPPSFSRAKSPFSSSSSAADDARSSTSFDDFDLDDSSSDSGSNHNFR